MKAFITLLGFLVFSVILTILPALYVYIFSHFGVETRYLTMFIINLASLFWVQILLTEDNDE